MKYFFSLKSFILNFHPTNEIYPLSMPRQLDPVFILTNEPVPSVIFAEPFSRQPFPNNEAD